MFDPFTAQEFQEGLREWDRPKGGESSAVTENEDTPSETPVSRNRMSGAEGRHRD
ncbi:hypothetical protein [Halostreptopolyspora alba]|uniref:hypothetical protein n=1 Tax=Halostreptopolyspora alba TaxID=2487137 RepID=UPI00269787FB